MKKRKTQQELINWLQSNNCKTEKEICNELWHSARGKKHADLLRRAYFSGKIDRVRIKLHGGGESCERYRD